MENTVTVANIMCGGCADTIRDNLSQMDGVYQVSVDVEEKRVTMELDEERMAEVRNKLSELGYPVQE